MSENARIDRQQKSSRSMTALETRFHHLELAIFEHNGDEDSSVNLDHRCRHGCMFHYLAKQNHDPDCSGHRA